MRIPRPKAPFPLLTKELVEAAGRKRTYVVRVAYALGLFAVFTAFFLPKLAQLQQYQHRLFGYGAQVFQVLVAIQFLGIFVFLPAIMSGVIVSEKERNSLPLLLVTDLRPREILLQKYFGGLLGMMTVLLISLPLFAVAYALGGVTANHVVAGSYFLLLTCLQLGAVSLLCSAFCGSVLSAFVGSYILACILYFLLPLLCGVRAMFVPYGAFHRLDRHAVFALFPFYVYEATRGKPFATVLKRSIPILMSTVVLLVAARRYLVRRALERSGNALLRAWAFFDSLVNWGVVLWREPDTLPDDEPVAWRELHKKALGKPRYLLRVFLLLEVPIVFFAASAIIMFRKRYQQAEGISVVVFVVWVLAALAVSLQSANAIPSERVSNTLDALLTSPLTGAEILRQKMKGVRRSIAVFCGPFLTLFLFEVWWERPNPKLAQLPVGALQGALRSSNVLQTHTYLLLSLLSVGVFLSVVAWLSLWIGLKTRTRLKAVLYALTAVVVLNAAPVLLVAMAEAWRVPSTPLDWNMLQTLSPASAIFFLEIPVNSVHSSPVATVISLLIYTVALIWIRQRCLNNADRYLGRTLGSAELEPRQAR